MGKKELDEVYEIIKIFRKHGIELIAFGGTHVKLERDKTLNDSHPSNNFLLNLNKYLTNYLPNSNGLLKNKSKFNQNLLKDLKKIGWVGMNREYYTDLYPKKTIHSVFHLGLKFRRSGRVLDIWPFMKVDDTNYWGLRGGGCGYIHKSYIENPVPFDSSYNILISKRSIDMLDLMYKNWRVPSKNHNIQVNLLENKSVPYDKFKDISPSTLNREIFSNFQCN